MLVNQKDIKFTIEFIELLEVKSRSEDEKNALCEDTIISVILNSKWVFSER